MLDNKQAAVDFLQMVVAGNIDAAYEKYVDMNGKHHNAYYAPGFDVLKQGMKDNHVQFPNKVFTTKNVIGDGDLVAVHSRMSLKPGEIEVAVVHIFRFKDGKIVEMWDVGQKLESNSPNTDGIF